MKKYVIFDLDDTLLDFNRGEVEGIRQLLREYQVPDVSAGFQTYLQVNHQVWEQIEQGANREQLLNDRFTETFARLGMTVDGAELERTYSGMLDHNFYTLPGASTLLADLQQAGVHLIAGTNGTKATQISRLAGSGVGRYFDDVFISEDVGYNKPDRRFFQPIFRRHPNLSQQNALMVGDRLQSDILGAERAELPSVWFNPHQVENRTTIQPTFETGSYTELKQLILA
ncbi:HAD superfamily hydrolase [Levilactobacillus senmaizukei DSM 21775 = NBRC 103853]|uniref:HAD superfamily hydrolase n=1 Tax=Levilactobacillus senmaizukei DSM 21775 = NBRC 103853 TaxID=1423803 RepID=A0A0R2DEC5_9LACO|nr:YjjG family noncanonical pyrimidine nucleotidase [Levilactobacillus senmaizukei]KRN02290.1 HAD superfamily hydrolase [Levilactobacillus senmaizukei DSM 21775 = NBRC 103853]